MSLTSANAPAPVPKDTKAVQKKRADYLGGVEDEVRRDLGMAKPGEAVQEWEGTRRELADLIRYKILNGTGHRMDNIPARIAKLVAKLA